MQLYLGLDPAHFPKAIHYPVIRTELILSDALKESLLFYPQFTHAIFTSKIAVRHWSEANAFHLNMATFAIGKGTAGELQKKGVENVCASQIETQEGMIELLEMFDLQRAYIFYPHSKRARPVLKNYLQSKGLQFFSLDLYDTILQRLEPVPSLDQVDEIIFTSPSTVDGFLQIYHEIPKDKRIICI